MTMTAHGSEQLAAAPLSALRAFAVVVLMAMPGILMESTMAQEAQFQRWDTVPVWDWQGNALANPWTGGMTAPQYSVADLDGDGTGDLFVFDRSGNRILVFQGCESDVPEAPLTYYHRPDWRGAFPTGLRNWTLLRDADCDGLPDLFTNSQSGIRLWHGAMQDGLIHFPVNPGSNVIANWDFGTGDQQLPLVCLNTDIPAIDDFDGDGDLDIVTWTETSSTLYSYKGRGATAESVGCGDTLIWDNRALLHRARAYDYREPRVLIGTRVQGDAPSELAYYPEDPAAEAGRQALTEELSWLRQRSAA